LIVPPIHDDDDDDAAVRGEMLWREHINSLRHHRRLGRQNRTWLQLRMATFQKRRILDEELIQDVYRSWWSLYTENEPYYKERKSFRLRALITGEM
jgi:hypothetical protein